MSEPSTKNQPVAQQQIPEALALEIRRLAHDLSNALEIIVQTSYLLNMAELKEPASDWLRMMDYRRHQGAGPESAAARVHQATYTPVVVSSQLSVLS